ncbi:MAG: apolipoprotein N-acyltransferase [Candidatus Zixiibacteriota bacterium]|nr:MAG: apolipoprotein N-acyltransferase [candidate division Zixibacteria bacterium]
MKSLLRVIREFFWPGDITLRRRRFELSFWAFLLSLAYLPSPLGFVAWFALARPFAIINSLEGKDSFRAAYFYAFMSNLFQLYWVAVVTPPGMIAAIFILSMYPAVILYAFNKLYRFKKSPGLVALPFLWVGMEYFRSLTQIAFPWTDLGYSQGYYLTLIQIISVVGVYGLSFALVVLNILVWQLFSRSNRLEMRVSSAIAFIGIIVSIFLYGWVVFPPLQVPGKYEVALLQGNVELDKKWSPESRDWNFTLYDSLAMVAAEDSVDLIIWPETSAPSYPRLERKYQQMLSITAQNSGTPNLVGALDAVYHDDRERSYNAAFQFMPDGRLNGYYHKVKLVPFSERAPYQEYLPFLSRKFLGEYLDVIKTREVQWWSDFSPGDSIVVFSTGDADYAVLICFEAAFPDYVRQCLLKGASFLVNITNDTWFGQTAGPYQHMRLAVFRAVENRVWLARCANSGITAIIDPFGRETERAGLYVQRVVTGGLTPKDEFSVFTAIGPVVGQICWLLTIILLSILVAAWLWKKIR